MSLWDRYADFVYRLAVGNVKFRLIFTLPGMLLFLSIVALFVLASIWLDSIATFFRFETSAWTTVLSILIVIIGGLICLWSGFTFVRTKGTPVPFNPPPKLITTGIYSYSRNPMLLGLFIVLPGLGLLLGSLSLILIFTPVFIVINILYLKCIEEKEMTKKFGEQYLIYKKKVHIFFPKFRVS